MASECLPEILDVPSVLARYRLRDARVARAIMHEVGALSVGRRLYVRAECLDLWERARMAAPGVAPRRSAPTRQVFVRAPRASPNDCASAGYRFWEEPTA